MLGLNFILLFSSLGVLGRQPSPSTVCMTILPPQLEKELYCIVEMDKM
jgi:hypothetical protein